MKSKAMSDPPAIPLFILCICLALVSGCVTTERGGIGRQVDIDEALTATVNLANAYIRDGKWEAAKRHLKIALEFDDNNADVYASLALVFQKTGEVELAEKNFKRALKIDSEDSAARNNYAAYLYEFGRYQDAIVQLQKVIADTLYRGRPNAFVSLGQSYQQLNQLDKALEAYERAIRMNTGNVTLMFRLAEVYYDLEDYASAQRYYDAFRGRIGRQPSRALWLGIRLANEFGNNNALSSYAMALKNLYPASNEYVEYRKVFK